MGDASMQYGVAGLAITLTGAVLFVLRHLVLHVLPQQHSAHVASLRKAHEACEDRLETMTVAFREELREQRVAHTEALSKLADRIGGLESRES